jgi:hypothetical protein
MTIIETVEQLADFREQSEEWRRLSSRTDASR